MKYLFILLLLTSTLNASEQKFIHSDKLQIVSPFNKSTVFDKLNNDGYSTGFFHAILKFDIDNVEWVMVEDINLKNRLCPRHDKKFFVFFTRFLNDNKNIKKLHIYIYLPCVVSNEDYTEHKALLRIQTGTYDKVYYENTVKLKIIGREYDSYENSHNYYLHPEKNEK